MDTIGTVYVFAPLAIATYTSLELNPTTAACAIVVSPVGADTSFLLTC